MGNLLLGEMVRRVYVFDLDDTLGHTNWRYELVHLKAAALVLEYAGHHAPYKDVLIGLQENIDDAIVTAEGFSEGYHETALLSFLEEVCRAAKIPVSDTVRNKMRELSAYPFNPANYGEKDLIDGVEETLAFLESEITGEKKKDELYILTRGVQKAQEAKIQKLGLYRFFDKKNCHVIVKNDKRELLEKLTKGESKENCYVVDDALSMINIATSIGLKGVFIPPARGTRRREKDARGILHKDLTIPLEDILKVKSEYRQYRTWDERIRDGDLPRYILEYDVS